MSIVRRILLIAALAALVIVPLRAFGVVGGESSSGLSVGASLGSCGVAGDGIVCQINVSFSGVEDADSYTASVTLADGSVQDMGTVGSGEGGGSATVYVPYVGAGTYSVSVSAWGTPDDEDGKAKLLERETDRASDEKVSGKVTAEPMTEDPAAGEEAAAGGAEAPATEPDPAEPPVQSLPQCQTEPAAPAEPAEPADNGAWPEAAPAPAEPPPAPIVECTTPSSDAGGSCCPGP